MLIAVFSAVFAAVNTHAYCTKHVYQQLTNVIHAANGVEVAREAANRWLDNIEALRDWAKKQFEGREADVDAFFEQVCAEGAG